LSPSDKHGGGGGRERGLVVGHVLGGGGELGVALDHLVDRVQEILLCGHLKNIVVTVYKQQVDILALKHGRYQK
jgi:hypothetical protein